MIYACLFLAYRFVRGSTADTAARGFVVAALVVAVVAFLLVNVLQLYRVERILGTLKDVLLVAIVIIFQPELRRAIVSLGRRTSLSRAEARDWVDELVSAASGMQARGIGAIVAIERDVGLGEHQQQGRGYQLDAKVTSELVQQLFEPDGPLHDGGIIIRRGWVVAAGCFFRFTDNPAVTRSKGARHRAALGLSEDTDAIVIVISEETRQITVAHEGVPHTNLTRESLRELIRKLLRGNDRTETAASPPIKQEVSA